MIALLSCSISSYANDNANNPSTGERSKQDSVAIAYDDLRIVNSKLIELEYTKAINNDLKQIISNDEIIIDKYSKLNKQIKKDYNKAIRQRNVCLGVSIVAIITSIILIVK